MERTFQFSKLVVPCAFALIAVIQLWTVASSNYIDSDDWFVVEMGRTVSQAPQPSHLTQFWSDEPLFRPLLTLRSAIEFALFEKHIMGRLVVNIALHALSAWLLLLCVGRLFEDRRVGVVAATLYLVHPLHAEALAWFHSGFEGITVSVFILLTLWLFIQKRPLWLVLLAFQAALFTRENALCIPFLIVVLAWIRAGDSEQRLRNALKTSLPYWAVLFANAILRFAMLSAQDHSSSSFHLVESPFTALLATVAQPFAPIHPAIPGSTLWFALFIGLGLLLIVLQRSRPLAVLALSALCFLFCALPFVPHFHVAERFFEMVPGGYERRWYFFHLPLAALLVWPAWLLVQWLGETQRKRWLLAIPVLLLFAAQIQNAHWWIERCETATQINREIAPSLGSRLPVGLLFSKGSDDANIADQVFLNLNRQYPNQKIRVYHYCENADDGLAEAKKGSKNNWNWAPVKAVPKSIRWWRWNDRSGELESGAHPKKRV
jgi:hypothetical protein